MAKTRPYPALCQSAHRGGNADQDEAKKGEAAAYAAVEEAYQFALSSPDPDPARHYLEGVYA